MTDLLQVQVFMHHIIIINACTYYFVIFYTIATDTTSQFITPLANTDIAATNKTGR